METMCPNDNILTDIKTLVGIGRVLVGDGD